MKKRVLISGGSRGIGAACVRKFTSQGDSVCFIYKNSKAEAEKLQAETGAFAIYSDIQSADDVRVAVQTAVEYMGGIDVLVNNAGISQIKMFTDITDSDWDTMLGTNLSGAFYLCRESVSHMVRQKYGRIINIGSIWGNVGASCEVHYSATKAGIRGLTLSLAKELGPSGITVNCVEPGVIETEMNRELDKQTIKELCEDTPLGRMGTPEEVAATVCFLSSDESAFITGQIIGVDGGFGR